MKKFDFSKLTAKAKNLLKFNKTKEDIDEAELETEVEAETVEDIPPEEAARIKRTKEIFDWMEVLVTAVIAVVVIFSMFFRVATIDGSSMLYTLVGTDPYYKTEGDRVIITNLAYTPKQGDIVVISRNANNSAQNGNTNLGPIIKRVIAVGCQWVDIRTDEDGIGIVYVDGVPLDEPYISTYTPSPKEYGDVEFPKYVPEGSVFVLGDNRQNSLDSRFSVIGEDGVVDTRYILGHAIFRIYPFNRLGRIENK